MTDREVILRMHLLQLQQMNLLICLSEKLNLMMRKTGMPESDVEEIVRIEQAMIEAGQAQSRKDWEAELKHLST